jgi:tetratricopeptide (TPR) repeat protein
MLYELKGDLDAARKEFEAALELNPDDENAKKSLEELGKSGE